MVYATLLSEEDLSRFRTKQCKRLLNGGCNFGLDRCQYSHNEFWNRRCPFYLSDSSFIRYITVMCPDVETKSDGSINSLCLRGGECPFAHSSEEILYHPLFYKTKRCEDYKKGSCNTYYCPYIHGLAETRIPSTYKLPFTNGLNIPNIPNIVIVDKIDINNKHNNTVINNKCLKNMNHIKKRNDLKYRDLTNTDMNCNNKLNCMASTVYSSTDSISNRKDNTKMNMTKVIPHHVSDNVMPNSHEEEKKFDIYSSIPFPSIGTFAEGPFSGENPFVEESFAGESFSEVGFTGDSFSAGRFSGDNFSGSRFSSRHLVNSPFADDRFTKSLFSEGIFSGDLFSNGGMKPQGEVFSNMDSVRGGGGCKGSLSDNNNCYPISGISKGNLQHGSNFQNIPSANYGDVVCNDIGSGDVRCIGSMSGTGKLSGECIPCEKFTEGIQSKKRFNNSFNMMKRKQNYSSCSTAAHEICFNEQEATSDEVIDDEEEELENDENANMFPLNKGKEFDNMLSGEERCNHDVGGGGEICCDGRTHGNEVKMLEVIKCLKILYEKIIRGNLVFTHEQWDNIAQITYDIIGVVEFNRVLKMKRATDQIKSDIYNTNKEFTFDMSKNGDASANIVEKPDARLAPRGVMDVVDPYEDMAEEAAEQIIKMQEENVDRIIDFGVGKKENFQSENKREDIVNCSNNDGPSVVLDGGEESHVLNLYHEQMKEKYLGDFRELNLLTMQPKFLPNQVNSDKEKKNSKDSHFLEFYNLNKSALTFAEPKEGSEKLSSQQPSHQPSQQSSQQPSHQPLLSFFSFLSE
ncbi:zinc finger protein, putative [Plasmodium ovale]|uniref:Zinc finger protein, putative n=1 Tax=Plasmodium ovale TaxID=36330 RepID=A0A1C3KVN6_PLAOA|nr:zinc finger protein, putative [Plasmodium ovale]